MKVPLVDPPAVVVITDSEGNEYRYKATSVVMEAGLIGTEAKVGVWRRLVIDVKDQEV